MKAKSKILCGCVAFVGVVALGNYASATTFDYGSYSVSRNNQGVTVSAPDYSLNEYGGSGQIVLNGTGANSGQKLYTWCLDVFDWLASSSGFPGATIGTTWSSGSPGGSNPNAGSSPAWSGPTASTVANIGGLMRLGDISLGITPNAHPGSESLSTIDGYGYSGSATAQDISAATQVAIWELEYQNLSGGFTVTGLTAGARDLANWMKAHVGQLGGPTTYTPVSLVTGASKQVLGYIAADNTSTTPLPASLPLFAAGLGFVGLVAFGRKRKRKRKPARFAAVG